MVLSEAEQEFLELVAGWPNQKLAVLHAIMLRIQELPDEQVDATIDKWQAELRGELH